MEQDSTAKRELIVQHEAAIEQIKNEADKQLENAK